MIFQKFIAEAKNYPFTFYDINDVVTAILNKPELSDELK
jgi:hypothetical protein